jgi:osmoprotectant transport system permease protein
MAIVGFHTGVNYHRARWQIARCLLFLTLLIISSSAFAQQKALLVGSKKFAESNVLGEIARRVLTDAGFPVERKQDMGSTGIVWEALRTNQIQCYPDYTGTISEEILKAHGEMTPGAMQRELAKHGVGMSGDLGFNDGYALAMRAYDARKLSIRTISDLGKHPELKVTLTHEFLERKDGWRPLAARYKLRMKDVVGVDHTLGYDALLVGKTDVKDAYTTDARLSDKKFVVLEDDLGYFPKYRAVFLYRLSLPTNAIVALRSIEGTISEEEMVRMNAEAEKTKDYVRASSLYFGKEARAKAEQTAESLGPKLAKWTLQHLKLVGMSLFFAILFGVPLGIVASRPGALSQIILGTTGVVQTIPSLALLALMVPLPYLGISMTTAIVALFLYSLLPIVRNTATGLQEIPPSVRESAAALGLEPAARLRKVFLPMASRTILAGVKTSAIINVGTATLAALIGAGGYGEPIISGLSLNDNRTILQGAIPAAVLALIVQVGFDLLDRLIIPRGLRLRKS